MDASYPSIYIMSTHLSESEHAVVVGNIFATIDENIRSSDNFFRLMCSMGKQPKVGKC